MVDGLECTRKNSTGHKNSWASFNSANPPTIKKEFYHEPKCLSIPISVDVELRLIATLHAIQNDR